MTDNILESIKEQLSIPTDDDSFDAELIPLINSAIGTLRQVGTTDDIFHLEDGSEEWEDYFKHLKSGDTASIQTYIYLKTRLTFDPPSTSAVMEAMKQTANELEWRINVEFDKGV